MSEKGESSDAAVGEGRGETLGGLYRFRFQLVLFVVLLGLFGFILASRSEPFNPGLEPLLNFGAAPLAAFQLFRIRWLYRRGRLRRTRLTTVLRRCVSPLCLLFATVAAAAFVACFVGDVSDSCRAGATSCVKSDQWKEAGGVYYRRFPYDAQGADDPNQPWKVISRSTYIAEVGTRLRSAAGFGVVTLCFAMLLTVSEAAAEQPDRRPPHPNRPFT